MDLFEKDSLGWQLQQRQQRVLEWIELRTAQTLSSWSPPTGLASPRLQTLAKVAFWTILGLLLTWGAWRIWQLFVYLLTRQRNQADRQSVTPVREPALTDWVRRSQKFQQQGNYREACLCLYRAMLQRLNDTGLIPHQPSRTDGEYLQLIQQLPKPSPYQTLLTTHQQLCFGNADASRSVFDQCQEAYREIEAS